MKAREILPTFIFLCDGTSHNPSGKRSEVMRTSLFEMDVPIWMINEGFKRVYEE